MTALRFYMTGSHQTAIGNKQFLAKISTKPSLVNKQISLRLFPTSSKYAFHRLELLYMWTSQGGFQPHWICTCAAITPPPGTSTTWHK